MRVPEQVYEFCGFRLDAQARALSDGNGEIPLRPKCFDLLYCLIRRAGNLVTKDELFEEVWPGIIVSDQSLTRCISDIRAALGDAERHMIRTIPGRGYQFAAEVTGAQLVRQASGPTQAGVWRHRHIRRAALVALAAVAILVPTVWSLLNHDAETSSARLPSIAVLPLRSGSQDGSITAFSSGLTADLTAALARIPELLVISETTTRRYAGGSFDVREVARELGVGHVLAGSIQAIDDKMRIAMELSDADGGTVIWSQRYDRDLGNFLSLQDEIVKSVLVEMQIELTHGESMRVLSRGTDSLEAWLLNIEGLSEGFKFTREHNLIARDRYSAAAQLDPDWATPVGGVAWTYREAIRRGWSTDVEADRTRWLELAQRCIELDPEFSGCYIQLGNYHIENGRIEEGIKLREKALELAPNDLSALSGLAWQLVLLGEIGRGLELLQRAKLVSPIHPGWLIATEAYAFQMDGQYDKAIDGFKYALANGDFPDWHARLAAVYAQIGDLENARAQARLFMQKRPSRTISDLTLILRIQDPALTQHYAGLLRSAGIPD